MERRPPGEAEDAARLAEELRHQRELTRAITDNAAIALFIMDKRGHPVFMNPAACAMTGYSGIAEIAGRPLHDSIHFKRPDGSHYPMEECPIDRANAEIVALKDRPEVFCRKDGTLFPVRYNVAPIERDGAFIGALIEVRDVTEQARHEAERARLLHEAEAASARLHALFLQAPAAIAIVDGPDHVFSFVNRLYVRLVGKTEAELLGRPAREALPHLVDLGFVALLDRVRATGEAFHAQGVPYTASDGRTVYHNFVYEPVREPDGAVMGIMGLAIDVTAQVSAQNEMRALAAELEARVAERTRKLTEANHELQQVNDMLQSFAYVISHDLKEPVRAIDVYLDAALEELPWDEESLRLVRKALEANRRQHALIQGLLAYSRTSFASLDPEPVDLTRLVAEGCRGYYETLARERGAEVVVDPLPAVRGNEVVLAQLFGNLLLNAIRHNPSAAPRVRVHALPASEGRVDVLVDDNGPGFPGEVRARLRELRDGRPSTIKGGFGLAISHRAAQRMGGELLIEDAPGGGARVRVRLQCA